MLLEISQNSQENTSAKVSFLIKLQAEACSFVKKDSGTCVFLWILWNLKEHLFYRTPSDDCFCRVFSDCITVCQHNFEQQKVFKLPAIILKTTLWHLCSPKFSKHLFHRTCETAAFQTLYATYHCFSSKETKYSHLKLFLSFQKASLKP